MNLSGGCHQESIHKQLLQEVKEEAVRRAQQGREGRGGEEGLGREREDHALCLRGPGTAGLALLALGVPWMGKVVPGAIPPCAPAVLLSPQP